MSDVCHFNGCTEQVRDGSRKCAYHRKKGICSFTNCRSQVYARGLCVRHGARKPCQISDCTGYARQGGFCCQHAGRRPKRSSDDRVSHAGSKSHQTRSPHGVERNENVAYGSNTAPSNVVHQIYLPLQELKQPDEFVDSGFSMYDITLVLSESHGLPVHYSLAQICSKPLPSIKLSPEMKPYFIPHEQPKSSGLN
ncbi:hypothetical protein LEN26_021405 [Aphanomyces euteiches]|nr:hypothetical protein LEN26_021405 [Aphanomyces euteiches]KAH9127878.1 hypothetical protein AeMF1_001874 [Aphanomyces euteiches]KAH9193204.1 hypothetical protein AeNC1_004812 [Aphanomyces euteiches]